MRRPLFWVALCLVAVLAVRLKAGGLKEAPEGSGLYQFTAYDRITVTGQVYQKDDQSLYLQNISVCGQSSEESDLSQAGYSRQTISCKDNIICKTEAAEEVPLGSMITLEGIFMPFSQATNPGEFDQVSYYRTLGVGGQLRNATLLSRGFKYWPVREALYDFKNVLKGRLYRALPEKEAGVLCALLLGDKDGLEEQVKDLYRQNGILHILSISSLHITILGMSLYRLLRRMGIPVWVSALAGSILLLFYGGMTGFGVSACRAIGMYLIRMVGEALGRTYDMLTALAVMAAVMVAANPYFLNHSGFLLSYSSVLGIAVLCPALFDVPRDTAVGEGKNKRFAALKKRLCGGINQSAAASFSVALATLPVQLWYYYEVPVYAVFLNLLVLPFVKILMLTGIATAALPGFLPAAAVVRLILGWYEFLCGLFGGLPFHTWNPGCPGLWQIAAYYPVIGIAVLFRAKLRERSERRKKTEAVHATESGKSTVRKRLSGNKPAKIAAPYAALACAVLILGFHPGVGTRIVFLDVGQGDCILVQTGSGENYLFDCGSSSRTGVGEYVLLPFLKYSGIHTLDAVFVSHPDKDHISGVLELLKMGETEIAVKQLILPGIAEELRDGQLGELVSAAETSAQSALPLVRYISAGDVWQVGDARFTCLHPAAGWTGQDVNAYSECFYVEFFKEKGRGERTLLGTLLLTGDVEGEGEKALLKTIEESDISRVNVLKVAHHGSRGSTSRELLKQITPLLSVISSGRNNSYGHPHEELLERLEEAGSAILGTAERGAVILYFRDGGILVETFLSGQKYSELL